MRVIQCSDISSLPDAVLPAHCPLPEGERSDDLRRRFEDLQKEAEGLGGFISGAKPEPVPGVNTSIGLRSRGSVSLSLLNTVLGPPPSDESKAEPGSTSANDWTSNAAETMFFKWEAVVGCLNSGYDMAGLETENLNSVPALAGQAIFSAVSMVPDILALRELKKQQASTVQLQEQVAKVRLKAKCAANKLNELDGKFSALKDEIAAADKKSSTDTPLHQDQKERLSTLSLQVKEWQSSIQGLRNDCASLSAASDAESISLIFSSRLQEELENHQRILALSAGGSGGALVGSTLNLLSVTHMLAAGLITGGNIFQLIFAFYEAKVSFTESAATHQTDTILQNKLTSSLDRSNEGQRMLRNVAKMARRQVGWKQSLWKGMSFFFAGISGLSSATYYLGYFFAAFAKIGIVLSLVATGAGLAGAILSVSFIIYKMRTARAKSSEVSELREAANGKPTKKLEEFRDTASQRLENKLAVRYLAEKHDFAGLLACATCPEETSTAVAGLCDALGISAKDAVWKDVHQILSKKVSAKENRESIDDLLAVFDRHASKKHRKESLLKKNPAWEAEIKEYITKDSLLRCLATETGMTTDTLKRRCCSGVPWREVVEPSLNDRARLIAADKLIKRDPEFALHALVDQLRQGNTATADFLRAVWNVPETDLEACRKAATKTQRSSAVGLLALHMGILKAF